MPESTVMVMPFIVMVAVVRIVRIMQTGVLDSVGTEVRSEFGKAKGTISGSTRLERYSLTRCFQ